MSTYYTRFLLMATLFTSAAAVAQNPFITSQFTADPSARVFGNRVYVYPSHDIPCTPGKGRPGWFCMEDYHVFSSDNLTDWTDHGVIVSQDKVPWVNPKGYSMWAPDCIYRNGKYYFYFPTNPKDTTYGRGFTIGVAVADKPEGPYIPQPEPIKKVRGIDPNVFIDKDGQAYLYWSQGNIYVAKLKENMLELDSEVETIRNLPEKGLKEGPYMFEHNGNYYLTFPHVENKTERLEYAMGKSPMGPFTMTGVIMDESPTGCWTNHHSILPFKGQWYLFYHHNDLSPQFDKNRSIRIDSLTFNADGTIRKVIPTLRGVGLTNAYKPIQIDRYSRISGTGVAIDFLDTLNRFAGWKTIFSSTDGWLQYNSVDFENREVSSVEVRAASTTGGTLQVRTDKADGPVIAEIPVAAGAEWKIHQAPVKKQQKNIHHLFITWKGQGNAEVDWIRMVTAQQPTDSSAYYNSVKTYVNPVLPGDHPDPTMLKVGNDFYHCGSSFHFTPYLPVYHSTDMVHWEVISRVVSPIGSDFVTDRPSGGIWQGAITYFYGSYWVYFSANGQWFSKATSPKGPWSAPVQVKTNPITGNLGYDNSIFVDDNGKPYMVIKNGQKVNRIQALGTDGQLTDTVINLDWINAKLQYSWAEGPVMSKRNGYYFYFPAGDVSGGQYVLRTKELTSDSTKWERLGNFFQPITDTAVPFHSPNHISAPLQLADGSWWTLGQSYERHGNDDWSGMGRQTALYPVIWEGNRPWGMAPTTAPIAIPATLPDSGIPWRSVSSDDFDNSNPGLWWHFLSKKAATRYSLTARKGWLRLQADTAATHIVQKETDHYYTAVTKVELDANNSAAKAGIYLTNGNQHVNIQLYSSYDNGKQIVFRFDTAQRSISNTFGNTVWLKLTREAHLLYAFASGDGRSWTSLGAPISSVNLDKVQPNYNSWVGTSIGLFAEGQPADFDLFTCKDGFTTLPAIGYSNYLGVEKVQKGTGKAVTGTSLYGGWMMISGVELGKNRRPMQVEIQASANNNGNIEIWLDQLGTGKKIAAIPVKTTGNDNWQAFAGKIRQHITGHHDVFIKFPPGTKQDIFIHSIRFIQ